MIVQNALICGKCGDYIFSAHRHDFKYCKCGAVAVDGGMEYLRRVGDFASATEKSYSLPNDLIDKATKAVEWGKETGRNNFGIALAVIRAIYDADRLITGEDNDSNN